MTRARTLVVLCLLAVLPSLTHAQLTTGSPPLGSFGGGPDVINLANLNSHIAIPVLHKPGRGTDFTYDLSYDSSVWYPVTSGSTTNWQPVVNWGWTGITPTTTGYATYQVGYMSCQYYNIDLRRNITEYYTKYYGWTYFDSFGISHGMYGGMVTNGGAPDCAPFVTNATAKANDGSGYSLSVDNAPSAMLITRDGATSNLPLQAPGIKAPLTDRNGNQ